VKIKVVPISRSCEICNTRVGSYDDCVCGKEHRTCASCNFTGYKIGLVGHTDRPSKNQWYWKSCPLFREARVALAVSESSA
jgi:hypothetical protein